MLAIEPIVFGHILSPGCLIHVIFNVAETAFCLVLCYLSLLLECHLIEVRDFAFLIPVSPWPTTLPGTQ